MRSPTSIGCCHRSTGLWVAVAGLLSLLSIASLPLATVTAQPLASSSTGASSVNGYLITATTSTAQPITLFSFTWVVPPIPVIAGSTTEVLYAYPYLASSGGAAQSYVQPVLSYTPNTGWGVTCYVEPASANAYISSSVSVQPGQLLTARVQAVSGTATTGYLYSCQFVGIAGTSVTQMSTPFLLSSVVFFLYADAPSSGNPTYYPACASAFKNISLQTTVGVYPSLGWSILDYVSDTGEHGVVVSSANPGGEVDLYWTSCQSVCGTCGITPAALSVPPSCAPGLWLNVSGSVCVSCPIGSSCSGGYSAPVACPAGAAQPLPGQSSCVVCLAGNYSGSTSSSQCLPCPLGTFSSSTGSVGCQSCAQGTFANHIGTVSCSLCPTNSSSNYLVPSSPTPLPTCTACAVGFFTQGPGSALCSPLCTAPTCATCPASCAVGSYLDSISGSCLPCPAGSSCAGGYSTAVHCPPGFNQSSPGQSSCSPCPVGQFSNTSAAMTCSSCAAGTFTSSPGSQQCTACAQGSAVNYTGATGCALCPLNSFSLYPPQGAAPLITCEPCPMGFIAPILGSTTCSANASNLACPAGYRQSTAGGCSQCAAGSFSSQEGALQCLACPAGQFTPNAGSVSCQPCAAGSFTNATGFSSCSQCPVGEFSAGQGNVGCALCPGGSFSNVTGSALCSDCPAGTFSSYDGAERLLTSCHPCPANTFNPSPGQDTCYSCLPQTFSGSNGSTSCQVCTSALSLTITQCGAKANTCPPGTALTAADPTANNNYSTAECVPCLPGYYSPSEGSTHCLLCPAQSYSLLAGSVECLPCEGLDGVSCSNGVVYVDDQHWGYANVQRLLFTRSSGSTVLAVNVSFATLPCPTGHCQGANSTQIDWTTLAEWDPIAQASNNASLTPLDGASPTFTGTSQSLAVGLVGQCDSGFDADSSNLLCGSCQSGFVPGGSGIASSTCVQCTEAHAGPILSYLLLPWAVVLGYYLLSYGKPGLVSVLLFFVQTCALMMSSTDQWVSWLQFFGYSPTRFATPSSCLGPMSPELQFALPLFTPLVELFWLTVTVALHRWLRQRRSPTPEGCTLDPISMRYRFPHWLSSAGYSHLCKKVWWAHPLLSVRRALPWRILDHALRTRVIPELTVSVVSRTVWLILLSSMYDVLNTSFQYFYCVRLPVELADDQDGLDSAAVVWAFPAIACSTDAYKHWGVLFAFYMAVWLLIFITLTVFVVSNAGLLSALQSVYMGQLRRDWNDKRQRGQRSADQGAAEEERSRTEAEVADDPLAKAPLAVCSTCGFSQQGSAFAVCPVCRAGQADSTPSSPVATVPRVRTLGCCGVTFQVITNQPVRPALARPPLPSVDSELVDSGLSVRPCPPIETVAMRPLPQPVCDPQWAQALQPLSSASILSLVLRPWLISRGLLFAPWSWYWPLQQQSEADFNDATSRPSALTAAELRLGSDSGVTASTAPSIVTSPRDGSPAAASTPAEATLMAERRWEMSVWYRFRSLYGCWFDSWHPSAVGWTLVMLLRQALLLVINAALALYPSPRYLAFALVLLSLLLLHLHYRPYAASQLNRLEAASLSALLVLALILDTYPPPNDDSTRGVLLAIIAATLLAMIAYAVLGPNELRTEGTGTLLETSGSSSAPTSPSAASPSSSWTAPSKPLRPPPVPLRTRPRSPPSEVSMSELRPSAVEVKENEANAATTDPYAYE